MRAYELFSLNESLLKVMDSASLSISDVRYMPAIREYMDMTDAGEKKTYVIQFLSDKYDVADRTLYRIIDKMMREI